MDYSRIATQVAQRLAGGIEVTVRPTDPGEPVYVYDVVNGQTRTGVEGRGPVVLAVDNLPCELPRESTESFSENLVPFMPDLMACDWDRPLEELQLPPEIRHAVIVHRGELVPRFHELQTYVETAFAPPENP